MRKKTPSAVGGALHYEFLMQIKRPVLWIVVLAFSFVLTSEYSLTPWFSGNNPNDLPSVPQTIANWSLGLQFLHPIAVGVLLADRLPRDRRTGIEELFDTLPNTLWDRFLGKCLGATLATLVPLAMIYAAGVVYVVVTREALSAVPLAFAAFATVNLPGLLFVAAFSISCTAALWVPLYQFLFIGYWFWGNHIPLGFPIPSLTRTVLMPSGEYMAVGFFGGGSMLQDLSVLDGIVSMSLLLGLGALAFYGGYRVQLWQRARR